MICIVCNSCPCVLRIAPGDDGEAESLIGPSSEWHPDKYVCPKCGEPAAISTCVDVIANQVRTVIDVTPMEAFIALSGAGLPEEHDCGPTAVEQLFTMKKIKGMATRLIHGSNRCIIDVVEFEDGTKAHFGSSALGATIFRISKPGSYVSKFKR